MNQSTLHDRLTVAAGSRTYRQLADMTQTHPETVRRYMLGQAPSVDFLSMLCTTLSLNATWMLTGRGPMRNEDVKASALAEADPAELLNAMADMLMDLIDRVDRIERFCQTIDARLGASNATRVTGGSESATAPRQDLVNDAHQAQPKESINTQGKTGPEPGSAGSRTPEVDPPDTIVRRAQRISDAIRE